MHPGFIVFLLILPHSLAACCEEENRKKNTVLPGVHRDWTEKRYKTLTGEIFMVPCSGKTKEHEEQIWSKTGGGSDGSDDTSFGCGKKFFAEERHSGKYTCITCGNEPPPFHLQVANRYSQKCLGTEENRKLLHLGAGGKIPCPGIDCNNNTQVKWYKVQKKVLSAVSEQKRQSCERDGLLHLCEVYVQDAGVYFCDREKMEHGVSWIFRRSINVTAMRPCNPICHPTIIHPEDNRTVEVELGQSHDLQCRAHFLFEMDFAPELQWHINSDGNVDKMTPPQMENQEPNPEIYPHMTGEEVKVARTAVIKEVTAQHLESTYTCVAKNRFGNDSVTIRLKKKNKVTWPSQIPCPVVLLLLAAGLGIAVRVKWLELQLIFRSYVQSGKRNTEDKEFDVLLSCIWSPASQVEGAHGSQEAPSRDRQNSAECGDSLRTLEALLTQVVEEQWGYRLCLLERDLLPGGAYTSDIVLAIQRSQMVVCVLSAYYLADNNAVFVLESAVQALLKNPGLKLLLIWTNKSSACECDIETPLPTLVQRALKVLPCLKWTSGEPIRGTKNFWRSLHEAMPRHKVRLSHINVPRLEELHSHDLLEHNFLV